MANLGGKKYGNSMWTVLTKENFAEFSLGKSIRYDERNNVMVGLDQYKPLSSWYTSEFTVCNQLVFMAYRSQGYDLPASRAGMKSWFASSMKNPNGALFEGDEIEWNNLEVGDVGHFGDYSAMDGHVYLISEKIVAENGNVSYRIIDSAPKRNGTGSIDVEFIKTATELKNWGSANVWVGRSGRYRDSAIVNSDVSAPEGTPDEHFTF